MSLLPTFAQEGRMFPQAIAEAPVEYEIDFATGQMTGRTVKGKDAVKVWIWMCLQTERFRYPIYSWSYGVEVEHYLGDTLTQEYLEADSQASIEEALKINPHITGISDFEVSTANGRLLLSFTANTVFGEVEIKV